MNVKRKNTAFTALLISASMLISKLCGWFRDIILAGMYGTDTLEAIAFSTASRIPLLFFDIALGTAVTSAFIPIYNEFLGRNQKSKAMDFFNRFLTLIVLVTAIITFIGIIFSGGLIKIIATGLNGQQAQLASQLVVILFPTIIITGVAYCFVGVLQSGGEFFIPSIISLVSNAILILYLLIFGNKFGVYGISVAMFIAWTSQILVQIPALLKMKFKLRFRNPFGDSSIKRVCLLALPIIISSWVQPINSMININLASGLNNGAAVPALDYANKLYIILVGVFTYTITNLIFPSLSRAASIKDNEKFTHIVRKSIQYVVFIISPIMAGFLILNIPIIRLFYQRGAFDANSTYLTSTALFYYSFGMLGFALTEVMNKSFYSLQNGKTPMRVSMISILINIILSLICVLLIKTGLSGLALSASIASNFAGLTLLLILNKKMKIVNKNFLISSLKILVCVTIMSIFVVIVYKYSIAIYSDKIMPLFLSVATGVIVYLLACFVFKVSELTDLFKMIKNKVRRRQTDD